MRPTFFEARGEIVSSKHLRFSKATDLALALEGNSVEYASFVESRRISEEEEVIVFDVDVEIAQQKIHDIHPRERIAVTFKSTDKVMPKVEALRCDFPAVPHLNLHRQTFPRDLCVYAERYEELKKRWTAARFIRDIREWLARTAKGQLHQPGQQLEPILLDYSGHIILPREIMRKGGTGTPELLNVTLAPFSNESRPFLITSPAPGAGTVAPFIASVHRCNPQVHGTISRRPVSLTELVDLVTSAGLQLIEDIRDRLKRWKVDDDRYLESYLVLVILFPKSRIAGGIVETVDSWSFRIGDKVRILGSKLGVWQDQDGILGTILSPDPTKRGEDVVIDVLNTSYTLDRSTAAELNGQQHLHDPIIAAIGMGALGSQVVINLSRSGFGTWTLIDDDVFMPHNLARHALFGPFVGWPKAEGVARVANEVIPESSRFSALRADVLNQGDQEATLTESLYKAHIILDMSTSVEVARRLACDVKSEARRISLFLTPSGTDLVLLAEDKNRTISLDAIEMQYYRAILSDERLKRHTEFGNGQQRYGQSCRDVTRTLSHNLVALHAAIGATALQNISDQPSAAIEVWRCDSARNVQHVRVEPYPVIRHLSGRWSVITDQGLLEKLHTLRERRLPNETGGVLLGSFDTERRLIYISDSLPSPADSKEWPTLYVRGSDGLRAALAQAEESTIGMLEYVGEWHSHPQGSSTAPSADDIKVFAWLAELMQRDGLPAVMMIVGDPSRISCFVGEIEAAENCL
jgi:proteasome lid subunit RPN8/RPN11